MKANSVCNWAQLSVRCLRPDLVPLQWLSTPNGGLNLGSGSQTEQTLIKASQLYQRLMDAWVRSSTLPWGKKKEEAAIMTVKDHQSGKGGMWYFWERKKESKGYSFLQVKVLWDFNLGAVSLTDQMAEIKGSKAHRRSWNVAAVADDFQCRRITRVVTNKSGGSVTRSTWSTGI